LTACSLNSAVYSCFGIFFTSRPSGLDAIHRPLEDEKRWAAHVGREPRCGLNKLQPVIDAAQLLRTLMKDLRESLNR